MYKNRTIVPVFMEKDEKILEKADKVERLDYIDSIKGIGIHLVVIGHHLLMADKLNMWIYTFHMPLFFVLSGFLSEVKPNNRTVNIKSYIKKKAYSLLWPYVTFSFVNIIWYILFHILMGYNADMSFYEMIIRTVTTYGYHALWFLPTMFFASLLSNWGEQKKLFCPLGQILLILLSVIVSEALYRNGFIKGALWEIVNYLGRIIYGVVFIGVGKYLSIFLKSMSSRWEKWVLLLSLGVSVSLYRFLPDVSLCFSRIGNPLLFFPAACAGSFFVILLCKNTCIGKSKVLRFCGKNSLIIMALHMDIPIQIGWIVIGVLKLYHIFEQVLLSVFAIAVEWLVLICLIYCIHRFVPVMIYPHRRRRDVHIQDNGIYTNI